MDDTKTMNIASIRDELPPGGQTRWSNMLNGAGNGGMIAGGALAGFNIAKNSYTHKKFTIEQAGHFGMVGTGIIVAATVLGAVHGRHEGEQIRQYREAVTNKIDNLNQEITGNRQKIEELTRMVHEKAEGHHHGQPR